MESLEIQQRVIELGKALVKELDVEPGNDTLSRWLVHYIAELMVKLENADEDQKSQLQQRCFETILKLWQHRSAFENGHRPFENFENILKTLETLDPENPNPFYLFWHQNGSDDFEFPNDAKQWVDFALRLDYMVRVWINFALNQAVQTSLDEKSIEWLMKAKKLFPDQEIEVIIRLTEELLESTGIDDIKRNKLDKIDRFKSRLEELNVFIKLSQNVKKDVMNKLQNLEQSLT